MQDKVKKNGTAGDNANDKSLLLDTVGWYHLLQIRAYTGLAWPHLLQNSIHCCRLTPVSTNTL